MGQKEQLRMSWISESPSRVSLPPAPQDRPLVDRELVTAQVVDSEIESRIRAGAASGSPNALRGRR